MTGPVRWRALGGAVCAAAAAILMVGGAFLPPAERYWMILIASGLCGVAAGLCWVSGERSGGRQPPFLRILLAALSAAGIAGFIHWAGMRQFGGFDHSALIDPAWRLHSGQLPFRDFPCPLPPAFYLGAAAAFEAFGVHWRSLVLWNAIFAVGSFIYSLVLLERLMGRRGDAWVLAIFLQATTTVLASYWWYNPITTVAAVLYFLAALDWVRAPRSLFSQASYGFTLVLLASMKPNIAGVLILGSGTVLLLSGPHRIRFLALSSGAALVFVLSLLASGVWAGDLLIAYRGIAGRGFSLEQFLQDTATGEKAFVVASAIAALVPLAATRAWQALGPGRLLSLAAVGAGVYGFLTNGENKLMDLPLLVFGGWFFASDPTGSPPRSLRVLELLLAWALTGVGLGEAAVRHRVRAIGPGAFFQHRIDPAPLCGGFFDGLRGSPIFGRVAREVSEVIAANPGKRVWFGPRMQWAYAASGIVPPGRQPSWWHVQVSYSPEEEDRLVQEWIDNRFDLLIFLGRDTTYLPHRMLEEIRGGYVPTGNGRHLTVLIRTDHR